MKEFFDTIRPMFGGAMDQKQVDGTMAILAATDGLPISHRAYILATAMHETAYTMQPIREYGKGKGKAYGKVDATGKAPYGRGYVQLTWRENYVKADAKLKMGGELAKDYDLALQPTVAAQILVRGMAEGWFTGKKLSDYLPDSFVEARRVVNGKDKADKIAKEAIIFGKALATIAKPAPSSAQHTAAPPSPAKPKATPLGALFGAVAAIVAAFLSKMAGMW